uniref:Hemerythrin-like domain-containing protein n=1 Tax=Magnetococcus massalia (strain MO-1) TaxID=451514 RepID=A0A1S7LJA8_MAGMO|nr:conserved protein of unknown function [Candidatus Magnetococcus massalia]
MDRDHQHLWDLLEVLMEKGIRHDETIAIVEELIAYTGYHFQRESQLMLKIEYPMEMRTQHEREHSNFVERVVQFKEIVIGDEARAPTELDKMFQEVARDMDKSTVKHLDSGRQIIAFLVQWIINHTNRMDYEIAKYIEAHVGEVEQMDFSYLEQPDEIAGKH